MFLGYVYGGLEFSRRDLMAINIQRGRDHGLSDYNSARRAYGLSRKSEFLDIKAAESNIPNEVRQCEYYMHINLTLQRTTENSLSRAGFELASSGF